MGGAALEFRPPPVGGTAGRVPKDKDGGWLISEKQSVRGAPNLMLGGLVAFSSLRRMPRGGRTGLYGRRKRAEETGRGGAELDYYMLGRVGGGSGGTKKDRERLLLAPPLPFLPGGLRRGATLGGSRSL